MTFGVFKLYIKLLEAGSSCDYESIKGSPMGGSKPMNLKKTTKKLKKIYPK